MCLNWLWNLSFGPILLARPSLTPTVSYFRLTESLRVDPSLTLACTAVPSPADPARFVVQLAVHNQGPAPAKLWNLINFSPQWKVPIFSLLLLL